MKKTLHSLLMTALLLSMAQAGSAKDKVAVAAGEPDGRKPVVVVSISGYDNVMGDIGFVGRLAQMPGLEKIVEGFIAAKTKAKGLDGLDTKRLGSGRQHRRFWFPTARLFARHRSQKASRCHLGTGGAGRVQGNGILELAQKNPRLLEREKRLGLHRPVAREPDQCARRSVEIPGWDGQAVRSRPEVLRPQHSGRFPLAVDRLHQECQSATPR